jgi:CelD/BcsL family acetyltransferase involved in cellulose biosynthesis
MSYAVTEETFSSLNSYRTDSRYNLNWSLIFVFPGWLQVWWQIFGSGGELYLRAVWQGDMIIGIAPLLVKEKTAAIVGDSDVCDYLDFVVAPGMERDFFNILLDDLQRNGINHLDLRSLRPDSTVLTSLVDIARERSYDINCQLEDVSLVLELPATWDQYLAALTVKQRHELQRKLRRLWEASNVNYHIVEDSTAIHAAMDTFLKLFTVSREDKATFMTSRMESFFRALVDTMTGAGLLRFGILELDTLPTAMVMCFDYNDCVYLYNSGYNPDYSTLSTGLISKVLFIQDSIQRGRKKFDFLKGGESYKYRLGGRELPLYNCQITIR